MAVHAEHTAGLTGPGAQVPRISFVVPVRNEERRLPACLASLAAQDYPREQFEILVVDGRSTDRTREFVRVFSAEHPEVQVHLLDNPRQTVAPGRNVGIRAARGEVIAFVEGHATLDPTFLQEAAACFRRPEVVCLGRYVEQYVPEGTAFQRATGLARKSRLGRNPHSGRFEERAARWMDPLGVATVYRREVFARVGLFEESFTTNEDVELNHRLAQAGVQAWYSPAVRYRLQPRESLTGLLVQMYRYGVGKRRFTRRHPEARRLAYAVPTLLCGSGVAAAVAAWAAPAVAAWVAVPAVGYTVLAVVTGARSVRHGMGAALLVPVAMLGMAVGFGTGYGAEAVRERFRRSRSVRHAPEVRQA